MKKNVFIVLLLLMVIVAAAMSLWLFFHRDGGTAAPPPLPVITTAPPERTPKPLPEESPKPAEPPEPTESPLPTETPAPTPKPTKTPEPTPAPYPADASGSFSSDTGTALNLLVNWKVYTDAAGNRKLEVALSATHYSLHTDFSAQSLVLTVNGQRFSANCSAINYNGSGTAVTPLHTFTLDAPSGNADIEAVWHFKGSYSGKELEQITASGTADRVPL